MNPADPNPLRELAAQLREGELELDAFLERFMAATVSAATEATVDLDRHRRCGFPEVVFAQGKSPEALLGAMQAVVGAGQPALATRVAPEQAEHLAEHVANGVYHPTARTFRVPAASQSENQPASELTEGVAIVTAGSSDAPVAYEACETLAWMGINAPIIHDVGVAGPQRLLAHVPRLRRQRAVIVVAGMEGALPSVVGGHVACPVIAVPTSVGYGASFSGVAALLGMLNSCAANVVVVNIDAGFKAGYVAGLIALRDGQATRLQTPGDR